MLIFADLKKFRGTLERVRNRRPLLDRSVFALFRDKTTSRRVIDSTLQHSSLSIEHREAHSIGVLRKHFVLVEDDRIGVKRDVPEPEEKYLAFDVDPSDSFIDKSGVHFLGLMAHKPE